MTNDELHQRLRVLEAHAGQQAQRVARLERQRAVELYQEGDGALSRIEVLEMRMNSQEGRLSGLVLRKAAVRRAKIRAGEEVPVRMVKTISFHLNFTVEEMAKYFEVNPGAIH